MLAISFNDFILKCHNKSNETTQTNKTQILDWKFEETNKKIPNF